jgi:ribonuclease HI
VLKRDWILTDKVKFGTLALKKQLVLNTWSGLLKDEDSLPDDWTKIEGVLVGIWPMNGIG